MKRRAIPGLQLSRVASSCALHKGASCTALLWALLDSVPASVLCLIQILLFLGIVCVHRPEGTRVRTDTCVGTMASKFIGVPSLGVLKDVCVDSIRSSLLGPVQTLPVSDGQSLHVPHWDSMGDRAWSSGLQATVPTSAHLSPWAPSIPSRAHPGSLGSDQLPTLPLVDGRAGSAPVCFPCPFSWSGLGALGHPAWPRSRGSAWP